jgi:hypothetical protein
MKPILKRKFVFGGLSLLSALALTLGYQNCGSPMSFELSSDNLSQGSSGCQADVVPHIELRAEPHSPPAPGRRMIVSKLHPAGCVSTLGLDTIWVVNGVKMLDTPKVFRDRFSLEGQGLMHVQLFVFNHRDSEIPACVFENFPGPCRPWVPEVVFHAELEVDLEGEPNNCLAMEPTLELRTEPVAHPQGGVRVIAEIQPPGCPDTQTVDTVWIDNGRKVIDSPGVFTSSYLVHPGSQRTIKVLVFQNRLSEIDDCVFFPEKPCQQPSPAILFQKEIIVGSNVQPPAAYQWISAHCAGQCVTNPWWDTTADYICVNTSVPGSPPDRPYTESACGGVRPTAPIDRSSSCPTVCSPWVSTPAL